jgi:hypothetical protein
MGQTRFQILSSVNLKSYWGNTGGDQEIHWVFSAWMKIIVALKTPIDNVLKAF